MNNIMITGGTSGLGYRTAFILAQDKNNKLILIGRNKKKGNDAVSKIKNETKNSNIKFLNADLSSINETSLLANKLISEKINVLINNAGALFYTRNKSTEGIEKTFALNHLSYFVLTNLMLKNKTIVNGGRIINVASGAHRGVDLNFDDIEMVSNYNGWKCYKKSKLCNILFTKKLSELTKKNKITVNCLHPGFVKTNFGCASSFLTLELVFSDALLQETETINSINNTMLFDILFFNFIKLVIKNYSYLFLCFGLFFVDTKNWLTRLVYQI